MLSWLIHKDTSGCDNLNNFDNLKDYKLSGQGRNTVTDVENGSVGRGVG